jgi:hypothetical protein
MKFKLVLKDASSTVVLRGRVMKDGKVKFSHSLPSQSKSMFLDELMRTADLLGGRLETWE